MKQFLDAAGFFLPRDHNSVTEVVVWRHKVAYTLAILVTLGVFAPIGFELRYVDKAEAAEAHAAIESRLGGVEEQLRTLTEQAKAEAIRDIRLQIYELRERACTAQGELRRVLNEQVEGLRVDYKLATNSEFPVISCAELIGTDDSSG